MTFIVEFVNNGTCDICANKLLDKKAIKKHTLRNGEVSLRRSKSVIVKNLTSGNKNLFVL